MSAREVPFREALRAWVRVALQSFGGPAGQIAVMHRILVEEKRWLSEARFLHALSYCMLLPGPEAQQLATYVGWLLHGARGGLVAGLLFVLPGFLAILAASFLYVLGGDVPLVAGLFEGLKAAVLAIVVQALLRIGKRVLVGRVKLALAAGAFVAIFALSVPFPAIVAAAALIGLVGARFAPGAFAPAGHGAQGGAGGAKGAEEEPAVLLREVRPSLGRALAVVLVWGGLWALPLVALALTRGTDDVLYREGVFFSEAAVVTFGGAYAVLSYVAEQAVSVHGWLAPDEMLVGLGLAETTPGPLIQVVQFVGFLGAWRHPGGLDPLLAGVLGALVTTWVTFAPCFLWIFLGAPHVERLRGSRALSGALAAVSAAVVGVILNLALWFALHALFRDVADVRLGPARLPAPVLASADVPTLALSALAFALAFRWRVGMLPVLGTCAALGALLAVLGWS